MRTSLGALTLPPLTLRRIRKEWKRTALDGNWGADRIPRRIIEASNSWTGAIGEGLLRWEQCRQIPLDGWRGLP